ncbi:MAG TPA: PBP1A family penicillin-binding protein [Stellaceae bacterium]|nr:PBP1A family penicillin-binding protein [Stellaceae bacterium]
MAEPRLVVRPDDRMNAGPPPRRRASGGGGPPQGPKKPPQRRRRWLGRIVRFGLLLLLWGMILGGGAIGYFALTLPDTSNLGIGERRPSVTILADDGSLVATFGDLFGQPLTLKQISPYLPEAVIATEDRRFYSHFGVDPIGLLRAVFIDLRTGHMVQGGSTITQQLAKNLFLSPERSLSRKIRETLLALWLEHRFSKDQILEIYLNRVYLGANTYGVDAAAHRYFGKSASKLSLYESAVIAGLLKAPTRFSPAHDRARAAARAAQVLSNMVEAGYISQAQAAAATRQGVELARVAAMRPGSRYFADWVADQVRDFAGTSDRDLVVHTTLDPRMQAAAEAAVAQIVARDGAKDRVSQGALVAMATDGAVRAMVGGRDYNESQFNRATQAQRQPGSSFKPFVYLAGLEAGLRPDDHFVDGPIRIGNWQPHNYTNRYLGDMTMAEGLAQSINTIAVQVAQRAGVANVVAVANRLGISSELSPDASIALGTNEVNLLELVSAYAPFANGGSGVLAYGIAEITDSGGRVIYRRSGSGPGQVIPAALAGTMNDMLSGVIAHGTGTAARLPRPAAGKTGTTQDYRDAWFIGYTADLVAGVWFGNDDNSPMRKVTGGSLPAVAWRQFMLAATKSMPVRPLPSAPPAETAVSAVAAPVPFVAPSASQAPAPAPVSAAPIPATAPAPARGLFGNFFRFLGPPSPPPQPAPVYNGIPNWPR